MREENFFLQSSLEANYLNIELQEPVHMDEIAVHVIKEDCPEFLIPFRIVNVNNKMTLKYQLINTIALEYSNRKMYKKEFVRLFLNLLTPFIKGKDWFLDYHNLCIDAKYIFLDKQSSNALFIYVPEDSYENSDDEILKFFKDIFVSMTIQDDANFQVKLYQYFSGKEFTLIDLYQMLLKETQNSSTDKNRSQVSHTTSASVTPTIANTLVQAARPVEFPLPTSAPTRNSLFGTEKKLAQDKKSASEKVEPASAPAPISLDGAGSGDNDAVMEALFGSGKKKQSVEKHEAKNLAVKKKKEGGFSLFGKKKQGGPIAIAPTPVTSQNNPAPQSNPVPICGGFAPVGGEGDDRTEIFFDQVPMVGACLELLESPIPGAISRIDLDFTAPFIVIGRMSSDEIQPDVAFSREFSRIGRKHARIEKRDGAYYVIDLGSANHTMLNGQVLIPNQPYQLMAGSELAFTTSKPVRYRVHL